MCYPTFRMIEKDKAAIKEDIARMTEKDKAAIKEKLDNVAGIPEDVDAYVEKSLLAAKEVSGILAARCVIAAKETNAVDLQNGHELHLWQRFWFLYAGDVFDRKILPCHDFPYEEEPIEFTGFDDLMPENWQTVYPETFWKRIGFHPIQEGKHLGGDEIPLAINIMVDVVNILILMWIRFRQAFWGWTGSQAVIGITAEVCNWLALEASREEQDNKNSRMHYDRCYRWIRWEAEKTALAARNDMALRGNYYVGILLEELIQYMLDHHFEAMPIFEDVAKMDEWRRSFDRDLQSDITWVLDKIKGLRHKLIVGKERKENV